MFLCLLTVSWCEILQINMCVPVCEWDFTLLAREREANSEETQVSIWLFNRNIFGLGIISGIYFDSSCSPWKIFRQCIWMSLYFNSCTLYGMNVSFYNQKVDHSYKIFNLSTAYIFTLEGDNPLKEVHIMTSKEYYFVAIITPCLFFLMISHCRNNCSGGLLGY